MNSSKAQPVIATAHTLASVLSRPEAAEGVERAVGDPVQAAAQIAFLNRLRAAIDGAHQRLSPNVMAMPHADEDAAREASILLSLLSSEAEYAGTNVNVSITGQRSLPGGLEAKFDTGDWFGWAGVALAKLKHLRKHELIRPPVRVGRFPNQGRIAVLGDWGTGMYGAPLCAAQVERDPGPFAMLLHLGDVYYSGTRREVQERFLELWPRRTDPGLVSRAINSNHEMYSGGIAYFDDTLPAFGQDASYFAVANDHWLLVGLDTAYEDHDLDERQVAWLKAVLALPEAGHKKVVLFSHQQLFSRFESQGWKLAQDDRLGSLLRAGRVTAWYWGHEHRCCLYERHAGFGGLLARCIGHSGMPESRKEAGKLPVEHTVHSLQDPMEWRRFEATQPSKGGQPLHVPRGLVLDGPNRYIPGEADRFAPNGYAVLEFNGPDLVEKVLTADGGLIHEMQVA